MNKKRKSNMTRFKNKQINKLRKLTSVLNYQFFYFYLLIFLIINISDNGH